MKILGIDSSGLVASAAIADEKNIIAEFTVNNKQTHSQTLLPMIEKVVDMSGIELEQIDAIAIAAGPGSFTGLRIGSATAKGIGLALKKPIVSVPTLEGIAYRVSVFDGLICPIMDARRGQVYTGIYKADSDGLTCLSEQKAVDIHDILKELEEYEQAINILIEELSMPYIPQQYENLFNAVYDEIILMKQEKNYQLENKSTIMSAQEIGRLLDRDKVNDDLIYMALDQLQQLNIRMIMPEVARFLKNPHKSSFAKTLIMEILIDQQVDEEFTVVKGDETYYFNGSYSPLVLERECYTLIGKSLSRVLEDDNPTLLSQCLDYLEYYLYTIYPKDIMPEDCDLVAATLHYYVATLQNMSVDPSDIEIDYNCDLSDVEKEILALKQLEC